MLFKILFNHMFSLYYFYTCSVTNNLWAIDSFLNQSPFSGSIAVFCKCFSILFSLITEQKKQTKQNKTSKQNQNKDKHTHAHTHTKKHRAIYLLLVYSIFSL